MSNSAAPYSSYLDRVRNRSLRSVIALFAVVGTILTLISSISLFQGLSADRSQHQNRLATFTIVLGSLYAAVAVMLLFGVVATITKRLALIRIFAFLSAVVTVIIIASGLLRTIVHFMLKDALISECTALATGQDVFIHWGFWGSDTHEQLTASQASQFCHKAWDHDSFSEIFWLLCEIVFMPLFTFLAFSYARQESALGAARNDLPRTYAPAYATGPAYAAGNESTITLPEVAYDQQYPPPPGSPPPFDKSLPAYGLPAYGEEADKKDTDSMRTAVAEDPFDHIEGYPRR